MEEAETLLTEAREQLDPGERERCYAMARERIAAAVSEAAPAGVQVQGTWDSRSVMSQAVARAFDMSSRRR